MVRILTGRPGVKLPSFLNTPIVHLNFSYRFGISDFEVDEKGIRASLSFHGEPHFCDIPWTAVCAIFSEKTDQAFVWITAFNKEELLRTLPPEARAMIDDEENFSVLDEFPELKKYAVDAFKPVEDEDDTSDDGGDGECDEDDEEDDDVPPGGYTPLRFV